jgi:hypothetical protein
MRDRKDMVDGLTILGRRKHCRSGRMKLRREHGSATLFYKSDETYIYTGNVGSCLHTLRLGSLSRATQPINTSSLVDLYR